MNINFSRLDKLQSTGQENALKQPFEAVDNKNSVDNEKTLKTSNRVLTEGITPNKQTDETTGKLKLVSYENIEKSRRLQREIVSGVRAGTPETILLLKAVEAIVALTGEEKYYTEIRADLEAIHGEGLGVQIPLEWALADIQEELGKLRTAVKRKKIKQETKARITTAIVEHEAREQEIKKQIVEASQITLKLR